MVPSLRRRQVRSAGDKKVVISVQVVTRLPRGLFSLPSAPISITLCSGILSERLEDALRDPRVQASVSRLKSNPGACYRIVRATIRRDVEVTPQSGTCLELHSQFGNQNRFRNGVLCVYIELIPPKKVRLQNSHSAAGPIRPSGLRRSERKRSSNYLQLYVPAFKSNVTGPVKSEMDVRNATAESCKLTDSEEYVVPCLPVFTLLPSGRDAIVCGLLDALADEGRLLLHKSAEKRLFVLFGDVSNVLLHLYKYWWPDHLQTLVPDVLLSIVRENDIRPNLQRVFSAAPVPHDAAQNIASARKNLEDQSLLAKKIVPEIKDSGATGPYQTAQHCVSIIEEHGGEIWVGSKLRSSIIEFVNKFRLWMPESPTREPSGAQREQSQVPQRDVKKESLKREATSLLPRRPKRRRKIPIRYLTEI